MSQDTIDTSGTVVVGYSRRKLALYAIGSAAFVAAGLWMIGIDKPIGRSSPETVRFWGYAAVAFFGLMLLYSASLLLRARSAVISLSPQGLRDVRVSLDTVPWASIASIGTWAYSGQRIMVLTLHPGEEAKLRLTRLARWTRSANAQLGADGLSITAQGTDIGHDALLAATTAFARRYGSL